MLWGWTTLVAATDAHWQATQDILAAYAELEPADDVGIYFTNEFIPGGE